MTTHRYLHTRMDNVGVLWVECSCGHIEVLQRGESTQQAFERHRALSRGRTRRPRPK